MSVEGPVLGCHAADVEGAFVVLPAALVGAHVSIKVPVGGGQIVVATPLGPRQDEELLEDPPPPPASTPPSPPPSTPPIEFCDLI